jgi:hypothetical protein
MMIDKIINPRRATILMSENQNSACGHSLSRYQFLKYTRKLSREGRTHLSESASTEEVERSDNDQENGQPYGDVYFCCSGPVIEYECRCDDF